jgi:hypothetical protein
LLIEGFCPATIRREKKLPADRENRLRALPPEKQAAGLPKLRFIHILVAVPPKKRSERL